MKKVNPKAENVYEVLLFRNNRYTSFHYVKWSKEQIEDYNRIGHNVPGSNQIIGAWKVRKLHHPACIGKS